MKKTVILFSLILLIIPLVTATYNGTVILINGSGNTISSVYTDLQTQYNGTQPYIINLTDHFEINKTIYLYNGTLTINENTTFINGNNLTQNSKSLITILDTNIGFNTGSGYANIRFCTNCTLTITNTTITGQNGPTQGNRLFFQKNVNATLINNIIRNLSETTVDATVKAEFYNNTFKDTNRCIFLFQSQGVIIDGNTFQNCFGLNAIRLSGANVTTINNNYINHTNQTPIESNTNTTNLIITNNQINDAYGIAHGIATYSFAKNVLIENNTLTNIAQYAIDIYNFDDNITANNNTIRNAANGVIVSAGQVTNAIITNNHVYNVTNFAYQFNEALNGIGSNNYADTSGIRGLTITNSYNITINNYTIINTPYHLVLNNDNNTYITNFNNQIPSNYQIIRTTANFSYSNDINVDDQNTQEHIYRKITNFTTDNLTRNLYVYQEQPYFDATTGYFFCYNDQGGMCNTLGAAGAGLGRFIISLNPIGGLMLLIAFVIMFGAIGMAIAGLIKAIIGSIDR